MTNMHSNLCEPILPCQLAKSVCCPCNRIPAVYLSADSCNSSQIGLSGCMQEFPMMLSLSPHCASLLEKEQASNRLQTRKRLLQLKLHSCVISWHALLSICMAPPQLMLTSLTHTSQGRQLGYLCKAACRCNCQVSQPSVA